MSFSYSLSITKILCMYHSMQACLMEEWQEYLKEDSLNSIIYKITCIRNKFIRGKK